MERGNFTERGSFTEKGRFIERENFMERSKKLHARVWLALCALFLVFTFTKGEVYAAKQVTVKVGQEKQVLKNAKNYKSSDKSIAYVTKEGLVVGKKAGTVTISAKKKGQAKEVTVKVKKNDNKNGLKVSAREIVITGSSIENTPVFDLNNPELLLGYQYMAQVTVKNRGSKTADKVEVIMGLGQEEVIFTKEKLGKGKSTTMYLAGFSPVLVSELVSHSLKVYSGDFLHELDYTSDKLSIDFAKPDTKAPKITGFVGKNSYNGKIPYQTIYSDSKNFNYFKYVKATDDRGGKVKLTVDTSKVDLTKAGTYEIIYRAEDKAGNVSQKKAKIAVRTVDTLDKMCSQILKSITKKGWSDTQKAKAIYKYTKGHISYSGDSDKSDWEAEAVRGIRYGYGDCFTYYAVARALLTRAGIPNLEVTRVRGHGHHWWCMAYVQGDFYHFDCCPRTSKGDFCLVTDEQLKNYSSQHGNSHIWDYDNKPKSGTKELSQIF